MVLFLSIVLFLNLSYSSVLSLSLVLSCCYYFSPLENFCWLITNYFCNIIIVTKMRKDELGLLQINGLDCHIEYFCLYWFVTIVNKILSSSSKINHIGTICGLLFLLMVHNLYVKVPCKRSFWFHFLVICCIKLLIR